MIRIGLVGIGFMGWIHYRAYQHAPGVRLTAVCSRDEKKRNGDWRGIQGNFGPPGEQVDLSGVHRWRTLDELLADAEVDLVDLCLPPHLHADAAIACLQAGKHVLCEKPMALTVAECERMTAVAAASGKQLLIGHVLPFFPEFRFALDAVRSGRYGAPLGGRFLRTISDPTWLADFWDLQRVGGPLLDLHVHDAHFVRLLFGMPTAVVSQGRRRGEVVSFASTLFEFGGRPLVVAADSGVIGQQGRPFTHGFELHLEQATLQYQFGAHADQAETMPLKVFTADGKVERPALGGDPEAAFVGELQEAAAAIATGRPSTILGGELARDAIRLCAAQAESVLTGRRVTL